MSLKMRKVKKTLKNPEKLKTLIYFLDVCDFCLLSGKRVTGFI